MGKRIKHTGFLGLLSLLLVALFWGISAIAAPPPLLQPMFQVDGLPLVRASAGVGIKAVDEKTLETTGRGGDLQVNSADLVAQTAPSYVPREELALADPSNYGDRYLTDIYGRPIQYAFIAVIHETVGSARSAINLFQTYHPRDADQVSYHTLIERDGTVVYIVPPEKRAYGAGNSVFDGPNGPETVSTNPDFPPSVNNFAYHVSLETPADGRGNSRRHSGYTPAQYESLAWLLARTNIPDSRITTHHAVDRSGLRIDPRSFDRQRFLALLQQYPSRANLSG